jgi:hypothetical protein
MPEEIGNAVLTHFSHPCLGFLHCQLDAGFKYAVQWWNMHFGFA